MITELILFKVGILKKDYISTIQTKKREDSILDDLRQINERQPKEEQLEDKEIQIYARNWEEKHLNRLKDKDRVVIENRIKEREKEKIKEQEIPYEILEKTGTTYKFDKGDDEHRR